MGNSSRKLKLTEEQDLRLNYKNAHGLCRRKCPDCGVIKVLRCREEGDLALEAEDEAGGELPAQQA